MAAVSLTLSLFGGAHDSGVAVAHDGRLQLAVEAERVHRRKHHRASATQLEELASAALTYARRELGIDEAVGEVLVARWMNPFPKYVHIDGVDHTYEMYGHHEAHLGSLVPLFQERQEWLGVVADGGSEDGCSGIYSVRTVGSQFRALQVRTLDDTPFTGRVFANMALLTVSPDWFSAHLSGPGKLMALAGHGTWDGAVRAWLDENWRQLSVLRLSDPEHTRAQLGLASGASFQAVANAARTMCDWWLDAACDILQPLALAGEPIGLVGGCAMNVVLVGRLRASGLDVRVPPVASDTGQAVGALLARSPSLSCDYPFLGLGPPRQARVGARRLASALLGGAVVGWVDGRAEIGPRALGHRSILACPHERMRERVSVQLKEREWYRPLGCIVRQEDASRFFPGARHEPFMTASWAGVPELAALAPSILHVDGTSRIQTVTQRTHPVLHQALGEMERRGSIPLVINTSLNGRGEPLAQSTKDALHLMGDERVNVLFENGIVVR